MTKTEVIRMVVAKEPQTIRQVAATLNMDQGAVSMLMRRMEESGRVKRVGLGERVSKRGGCQPYLWGSA